MAYRTGTAIDSADMLQQLLSFLSTVNEFYNITVTGSGDGELTSYSAPAASPTEEWVLTCTSGGPSGTFSVEGSVSGVKASATSGVAYDNGIIAFTITDGASAWQVNDTITFTMYQNMGTETPYDVLEETYVPYKIAQSVGFDFKNMQQDRLVLVPGKYPDTYALKNMGTVLRNTDPQITSELGGISESRWDSLPSEWSISFWTQNTMSYNPGILASPYSPWSHYARGNPIFIGGSYNGYKTAPTIGLGCNKIDVATTLRPGTSDLADILATAALTNDEMISHNWVLFTITCDGTTLRVYKDDAQIATSSSSYVPYMRPFIFDLLGATYDLDNTAAADLRIWGGSYYYYNSMKRRRQMYTTLFDFCVWNKELSLAEVGTLYNATEAVDVNDSRLLWKLTLSNIGLRRFAIRNVADNGTDSIFTFTYDDGYGQDHEQASLKIGCNPYYQLSDDLLNEHNMEFYTYAANYNPTNVSAQHWSWYLLQPKEQYVFTALRKINQSIEKYWFVANNNRIIITYLIHDITATNQKNPIYQTAYVGYLESGTELTTLGLFGTSRHPVNWETQATSFTFGLTNTFTGYINAAEYWQFYDSDYGGSAVSDIRRIDNIHYLWPIMYYRDVNLIYYNRFVVSSNYRYDYLPYTGGSYDVTPNKCSFGSPIGVYKIAPYYVTAGDIITVDGDDHLVVNNVWQNSPEDWFAIKLA